MHRYQILIEYVGTNFIGWQIQSKGKSIQKLIQKKLSKILKAILAHGRGEIGEVLDNYLEISCGNKNSIKVLEIQRQGKRPQNIGEFMFGSQIKKGSNLSNA